ncbi:hypothetical protein O0I10_003248 [Lichtheimia ornata]|uniref:Uncharacterized protein n=1 Tax=Lichtheimia ornata TaxID=688661 RepID=A0AAD7Y184_9FUNG|nr:uncharacterized protein O0I10_003248 [Lichtheimia ornata]KAJ8661026.1 hypothetical protein O0I10_003248 [Lichtheimia ornata]
MPSHKAGPPTLPNDADVELHGPLRQKLFNVDQGNNRDDYSGVHPNEDEWEIVTESEAQSYLPEGNARKVMFGIKEKTTVDIPLLGTESVGKHVAVKPGYVINNGGAIWGLGFAPKRPDIESDPHAQYLAITGFRGAEKEHHKQRGEVPTGTYKNAIQIWKLHLSVNDDPVEPRLDLCLLHDFGPVKSLDWCPYGAYEEELEKDIPKLGILSIVCGDNTVRLIVVPHPNALRQREGGQGTLYLRLKKVRYTLKLNNMIPMVASWGGHSKVACGFANGMVAVLDAERALMNGHKDDDHPQRYVNSSVVVHASAVRNIAWHGVIDPVNFASCGSDGCIFIHHPQDPRNPIMYCRTRSIAYALVWPGIGDKLSYMDGDNILHLCDTKEKSELSPGNRLVEGNAASFSIAGSEMHPFLSITSSDGWLKIVNAYVLRRRGETKYQNIAYKLEYDPEEDTFQYIDGLKPMSKDQSKKEKGYYHYMKDSVRLLTKTCWCPNTTSAGWIASGGAAGLCRVEFVGRGTQWT